MSDTATAPFDGSGVLVRSHLRRMWRAETDPAKKAAIKKALDNPDFSTDLGSQAASAVEASGSTSASPGWFAQILAWLEANWGTVSGILALILALFGVPLP